MLYILKDAISGCEHHFTASTFLPRTGHAISYVDLGVEIEISLLAKNKMGLSVN